MNHKYPLKKLNKMMKVIDEVKDSFCPDDDEELASQVLKIEAAIDRAIKDCEICVAMDEAGDDWGGVDPGWLQAIVNS